MKKLFTVILISIAFMAFAQKVASQEIEQKIAKAKDDTSKVDLLNQYVLQLINSDIGKAEKVLNQNYELIQKLKYQRGEAYGLLNLSRIQKYFLSYEESFGNAGKAIEIFDKIGDKRGLVEAYMVFANIHNGKSNYPNSLDFFYKALLLSESEGFEEYKSLLNLQIAYTFSLLGDVQKSETYLQNFFSIEESNPILKNNYLKQGLIGEIYTSNKKYQEAIKFYQNARLSYKK